MKRFLWLMPICVLPGLAAQPRPAQAAALPVPRTFDSKGVKIRYFDVGQGQPVVLIHALHSSALINWQLPGILPMLAEHYRVIAPDLRGHGGSGKPERESAYGVELMEDVVRLLDHLETKQAHFVSYSMGGMVTMKLITRHPERVLSATLGGMGWLREGTALQRIWGRLPADEGSRTPAACVHSLGALAVNEDEVKAIKIPVQVLIGDRDPVRPLYVEPLERARPDWPVIVIENAGHINGFLKPQFKDEIWKWLETRR
jgi:pimeloyl-ACP methyl ester carboxylesterase